MTCLVNVVLVIDYAAGDTGRPGHMATTPVMLIHARNAVWLRQLQFDLLQMDVYSLCILCAFYVI